MQLNSVWTWENAKDDFLDEIIDVELVKNLWGHVPTCRTQSAAATFYLLNNQMAFKRHEQVRTVK